MLSNGDKIGPYTVRETAGQGGMATVYKAWHEGLHRFEALKVPRGAGGSAPDSAYILRLLTEARVAAGLHHPHIVAIHGVSEPLAPIPFFAMDWVEGRDLAKILSDNRAFSLTETVQVLEPVASALDYAHEKGVVHRDIKPANILISEENGILVPRVVDFGISRAAEDEDGATKLTKSGMIVGTPEYMSPEQAGSGELVDYRTDIYSLAVVAYEMLCGKPPFTAGSGVSRLSILISHVRDVAPLFQKFPDFPREAGQVLLRALSKSPTERPKSCAAFLKELKAAAGQNTQVFASDADFERTAFDASRFEPAEDATIYERPLPAMNAPRTLPAQPAGMATAISSPESSYSLRARLEAASAVSVAQTPEPTPSSTPAPLAVNAGISPKTKLLETSTASPTVPLPEPQARPGSRIALIAGMGGVLVGALLVFSLMGRNPQTNATAEAGVRPAATQSATVSIAPVVPAAPPAKGAAPGPRLRTARLKRSRDIDFETIEQRSASRAAGSTAVLKPGQKGTRELTFVITYQGDKEMARRVIEDRIVRQPVAQVVEVGTRPVPTAAPLRREVRNDPAPVRVRTRRVRAPREERPAPPRRASRPVRKAVPRVVTKKRRAVHEAPLPP